MYNRQLEVFDPDTWRTPLHVIGAGATGSWLVLALAKLGIKDITVWDFDIVEEHNVPNQLFGLHHVGKLKIEALAEIVKTLTNIEIKIENEKVTGKTKLEGVVFVMTDTMQSRLNIWEGALKYKVPVKLVIEPRMSLSGGRLYCINPLSPDEIREYEKHFYTDEEAEVSACGVSQSVVATAMQIASMAVWKLINYHNNEDLIPFTLMDFRYNSGSIMNVW